MNDSLTKLYAGLTDKEKAVIAFTYRAQRNDLETARIESAMAEQSFIGLPYGYRRMTGNLQDLALVYATEYWRHVALCQAMMAGTMALIRDDDPEAYKPVAQRFKAAESALLAIEQAFDDVCLEHGLDQATMRTISGERFYEIANDVKPNDVCLAGYRDIFAKVMK